MPKPLIVWITINCGKFLKSWEYQTCLFRILCAGQEATTRTGEGTMDWFQMRKGVRQVLSPCLFTFYQFSSVQLLSLVRLLATPQQWPRDWKRSVFIPIPKKDNAKEYSNYCTIALISHTSKVMFKILQARLQQYVNHELPDI